MSSYQCLSPRTAKARERSSLLSLALDFFFCSTFWPVAKQRQLLGQKAYSNEVSMARIDDVSFQGHSGATFGFAEFKGWQ